jgi:aminoglycoside phosphotransferase (APT) family kinase protein
VPAIAAHGWRRLAERSPEVYRIVGPLVEQPGPLLDAFASTPMTFLHGDWKAGNLGSMPDGRTILLDWAIPGEGPPCGELAWYLSLNAARLPNSKEEAIATYREALERHGVDTTSWWDVQLGLALLGGMVQFGWEKALGSGEELVWWEARVLEGAALLA